MIVVSNVRVIGSNNFSVQLEPGKIIFSMEGKYLHINVDEEFRSDLTLYKHSIRKWLPPHSKHMINDEHKENIISRIIQALRLLRINCVFH